MKTLKQLLAISLITTSVLIGCESPSLDDPYRAANNTAVYRVKWDSSGQGKMYNMSGDSKGTIYAEDMKDINDSVYYSVGGHRLEGWMYYDPNANRLYLEDSGGGVGRAINSAKTGEISDTSFAGMAADARNAKVDMVARGLNREYSIPMQKATVIASALQNYHESKVSRGFTTSYDVEQNFKKVFGVEYGSAMAAVESFRLGRTDEMREITNSTSNYLGLKPHQAKRFMKDMYRGTLEANGYNVEDLNW